MPGSSRGTGGKTRCSSRRTSSRAGIESRSGPAARTARAPMEAGHDVPDKRRAEGDLGDPFHDVLHPAASKRTPSLVVRLGTVNCAWSNRRDAPAATPLPAAQSVWSQRTSDPLITPRSGRRMALAAKNRVAGAIPACGGCLKHRRFHKGPSEQSRSHRLCPEARSGHSR